MTTHGMLGELLAGDRARTAACAVVWLCVAAAGMGLLLEYETTPGEPGEPPSRWPAGSILQRAPGLTELVMAIHPHCPCSRATLTELELIMARCQGRLRAHLLFLSPPEAPRDWPETDLWARAKEMPGLSAVRDIGGAEARLFGIVTSGHALLYDARGTLEFSGGITAARGHEGESAGSDAILALVNSGAARRARAFVYGCSLRDPASSSRSGVGRCRR